MNGRRAKQLRRQAGPKPTPPPATGSLHPPGRGVPSTGPGPRPRASILAVHRALERAAFRAALRDRRKQAA